MNRIRSVIPKEAYTLEVNLDNGRSILLNMGSRLGTVRFGLLADREFFLAVSTDGNYIRWKNRIEISVSELLQMLEK